ncbi:heterokaryon incompatibility protein-domain-containing protein [Stachybotrys elegans]|uniref:Heterokaryon incompatibility protein-domain-containing protein n=1 Tax=Stachybotrys elegans TaxID=80388 RepID=A0A8K0SLA7_9HYPO|nr:heterokaryon incompatibility protein-domain-containing protein [Stachybotrys elegans]
MRLFNRSKTPWYSVISKGLDRQSCCRGCSDIGELLQSFRAGRADETRGRLPFHSDFAELAECAQRCWSCCIIRQALLSECTTSLEASRLGQATAGSPVYARVSYFGYTDGPAPTIHIEIGPHAHPSAMIRCTESKAPPLNLAENPNSVTISGQVKEWLADCRANHVQSCSALRYSSENPTRLIRIVSESKIQLCMVQDPPLQYAALSYCWGVQSRTGEKSALQDGEAVLSESETALVYSGMTRLCNIQRRLQPFDIATLPSTLQDAIVIIRRTGLEYAWIDSVCIIQDDVDGADFFREASKMHQYYGNAAYTLAICSNSKATAPILTPRTAFSYRARECRLGGLWLEPQSLPLGAAMVRSPLKVRAWTLQEEHLSPRILFWTPNRMYWSCAGARYFEMPDVSLSNGGNPQPSSQNFLLACHRGTAESRHRAWISLVSQYALRGMTNPTDRFPALSGLASRYQSSCIGNNLYLAGLWQETFSHDLSWRVIRVAKQPPDQSNATGVPSWTWASLPLYTGIQYGLEAYRALDFELLQPQQSSLVNDEPRVVDGISRGALVKMVSVKGRLRSFWLHDATFSPWYKIQRSGANSQTHSEAGEIPLLSFDHSPETPMFSAYINSGLVVAYDARKQEVIGHLDYQIYAERVIDQSSELYALELATTAMLLLEYLEGGSFRRVGVAFDYRPDFFDGIARSELVLV